MLMNQSYFNERYNIFREATTPSQEENLEMLRKIREGNAQIEEEFVIRNGKLVFYIARNFLNQPQSSMICAEDLIQEGFIGLHKAIHGFDLSGTYSFSTYAAKKIQGYILNYLNNQINIVHYSQDMVEKIKKYNKLIDYIAEQNLKISKDEIWKQCNITNELEYEAVRNASKPTLYIYEKPEGSEDVCYADILEDTSDSVEKQVISSSNPLSQEICDIIKSTLSETEAYALLQYFGVECDKEKTYQEIAERLGISARGVKYVIDKGKKKLTNNQQLREMAIECHIL